MSSADTFRELVLLRRPLTAEHAEALERNEAVVAFGAVGAGEFKAFAYAVSPTTASGPTDPVTDAVEKACFGDPDCVHALLVLIGRVAPCTIPEARANLQALLHVEAGARREVAAQVLRVQDERSDVRVAAAHLLGAGPFNMLVEVVGDDLQAVHGALLEITDNVGVVHESTHLFRQGQTVGWGG